MNRGQIILIGAGILIVIGFIIIICSGSAIISIGHSLSLDQIVKTFTGNMLGNVFDRTLGNVFDRTLGNVFDRSGNIIEPNRILTDESTIILGISVFGILAGIILIVNGIISIIIGIIFILYDRRKHKQNLKR